MTDFNANEHAKKLFNHPLWVKNHYEYGLKSALRKKKKGIFDSELNKKAGFNLSKLGDYHLKTKLTAAQHREVGNIIADKIEKDMKLYEENNYKDGDKVVFKQDTYFGPRHDVGIIKKKHDDSYYDIEVRGKAVKVHHSNIKGLAESFDFSEFDDSPIISRKPDPNDAKRKAEIKRNELLRKITKVNVGNYGKKATIDHEHEFPANEPEKKPQFAGADNAMKAFGLVVKGIDAKNIEAPKRPRGRAATPEAKKAYRIALRKFLQTEAIKNDKEIIFERSAAAMGRVAEREFRDGVGVGGGESTSKKAIIGVIHPKLGHIRSYPETADGLKLAKAHALKIGGTIKRLSEGSTFELITYQDGLEHHYILINNGEIIKEGSSLVEENIFSDVFNLIEKLNEEFDNINKNNNNLEINLKEIIKRYVK